MKITCTTCKADYNSRCPHCGKGSKPISFLFLFALVVLFLLTVTAIVSIGYAEGISDMQEEAVRSGHGEWKVQNGKGHSEFEWKKH